MQGRTPEAASVMTSVMEAVPFCDRAGAHGYHQKAMHLGDSIFILILALVLLGPKKTSELAGQLGKLMSEFRKASNDFKYQFNEEMRVSEQQEQQKKQEAERAALPAPVLATGENTIMPPMVQSTPAEAPSEAVPYAISAVSATTGEEQAVEDHPLLRVDVIPPMNEIAAPANGTGNGHHTSAPGAAPPVENEASVSHGS